MAAASGDHSAHSQGMPSTSQAGLGVYTHPPAVPQAYVTPAAQMSAPATQQMQPAAQKYVQLQKRGGGVRAQVAPVHPLLYTCRHRRSRSRSRDSGRSRKGSRRDRRSGSRPSRRHRDHKTRRRSRSGSRHKSKKSKKSRRHASSSSSSSRSPSPRRGDRARHGSNRQTHSAQYDQNMGYQQGQQFAAPYGKSLNRTY